VKVLVETSARHVHLTREDMDRLFGAGSELTKKKDLSQPGEFASEQRVDVVGPKNVQRGVNVLGPLRGATQVEISLTDARNIGVDAPVRESGDVAGSATCKLVGPAGSVELTEGVIAAKRHVHLTPQTAMALNISNKQIIKVALNSSARKTLYDDVVARVSPKFADAMHVDTDEANAAGLSGEVWGEIIL